MLLDQATFKDQSLDLAVRDDVLDIMDLAFQVLGLMVELPIRLEVRPDSISEILRLADVNDLSAVSSE